jgi:glucose/mannose transport system substrate-binding protein
MVSLVSTEIFQKVYGDKDAGVAAGPEVARVFKAAADAREISKNSTVQSWNEATNLVITGQAGGQIMGDWAQGEFSVAQQTAGDEYECLPGLGVVEVLSTGGDAFYFPKLDDPEKEAAQKRMAALLLKPAVQVAFNLKKGSLPVRGDIDLSTANGCMKKGLKLLAEKKLLPDTNLLITPDTSSQLLDLFTEFFADKSMSPEAAQERFVDIIAQAD